MKRDRRPFDWALDLLLERGRIIPPAPGAVRARALARARAAVAAATVAVPPRAVPARRRGARIAVAASLILLLGAAGATATIRGWLRKGSQPSPPSSSLPVAPVPVTVRRSSVSPVADLDATPFVKLPRRTRPATAQESYAAELDVLQRAQAAYARRDFADALVLVAEHGRVFPNGRLAEQREALRVRSLAGAGRSDDARRAVAAFAHRFPRSALLQRLRETSGAAE